MIYCVDLIESWGNSRPDDPLAGHLSKLNGYFQPVADVDVMKVSTAAVAVSCKPHCEEQVSSQNGHVSVSQ